MINPTQRNRNIGTANWGYGEDNKLVVPYPVVVMKWIYERFGEYKTIEKFINGRKFNVVVEKTCQNSFHGCTIEKYTKSNTKTGLR